MCKASCLFKGTLGKPLPRKLLLKSGGGGAPHPLTVILNCSGSLGHFENIWKVFELLKQTKQDTRAKFCGQFQKLKGPSPKSHILILEFLL